MTKPAVVVENLTKIYRIGRAEQRADTLVGAFASSLRAPVRNFRNLYRLGSAGREGDSVDTIRAVDDVSFDVRRGEVLGIIGRNGAGKSTLLKILSRITKPTSGRILMRGRVSSLLEVGTGFHPELTGRENVYLNGTILGMTKQEIDRKFDQIVDFSGVEKFLDTPVKRYSSGMKVRLAFAVAAHLEPEVLIVDEVLAVGDADFQRKCIDRMRRISGGNGNTVLFVSHNLGAVAELCNRGALMDGGRLAFFGDTQDAIRTYSTLGKDGPQTTGRPSSAVEVGPVRIADSPTGEVGRDQPLCIEAEFNVGENVDFVRFNVVLLNAENRKVFHKQTDSNCIGLGPLTPGVYRLRCTVPPLWLAAGIYSAVVKLRPFGTSDGDKKAESSHIPIVVKGQTPRFGNLLEPDVDWSLGRGAREEPLNG